MLASQITGQEFVYIVVFWAIIYAAIKKGSEWADEAEKKGVINRKGQGR